MLRENSFWLLLLFFGMRAWWMLLLLALPNERTKRKTFSTSFSSLTAHFKIFLYRLGHRNSLETLRSACRMDMNTASSGLDPDWTKKAFSRLRKLHWIPFIHRDLFFLSLSALLCSALFARRFSFFFFFFSFSPIWVARVITVSREM